MSGARRPPRYDFIAYNRYGVLRPSLGLWLSLVFLCRHVATILLVVVAAGRGARDSGIDLSEFGNLVNPLFILADLPAMLLLLALAARMPTAGSLPRVLWRSGRFLLLAACLVYAGLILRHVPVDDMRLAVADWLGIAGTAGVALYAILSPYLGYLFREFPERSGE